MPSKLPGPLRLTPSFPFAGRVRELATLRSLLPRVEREGLRFALVGGEAGSGKSRLVREFAHEAAIGGAIVLYGGCDSVVRRPYRPFVEALGRLVRDADPATLRAAVGPNALELTRLLPDLPQRLEPQPPPRPKPPEHAQPTQEPPQEEPPPDPQPSQRQDPDTERHRLHTAVADLLEAVGRTAPLLVVIEDGHWADTPTLLLLRHLARSASEARALLLTTFRDTEAEVPQALYSALVDLRRSEGVVRLKLEGLSAEEISEFVHSAAGDAPAPNLREAARVLHELTEGNPFLMTELWRTLTAGESISIYAHSPRLEQKVAELGSPEGVRELVSQRLAGLSGAATRLLELGAVAGPEFDLALITAAMPPEPELPEALEEGVAHGLIVEVPSRRLVYRFTHELVRRAIYDRLPALRRAGLHLKLAEALERTSEQGENLGELAHHFGAAAPLDGPRRAIEYSLLAGRSALAELDFDAADALFTAALELGIDDPHGRGETELERGLARCRAGRSDDAIQALRAAAQIARELGDAELLAGTAVAFEEACARPGIVDAGAVDLLEEASRALPDEDSELRVMVLTGLSRAYSFVGDHSESSVAEADAIAMARRLGDRRGLATALMRSYWSRTEGSMDLTLERLSEAREVFAELGASDAQAEAMLWHVAGLMAVGTLGAAEHELAQTRELALRLRQPFALHVVEQQTSAIALSVGRLADAEAAARRSAEWSRLLSGRAASAAYGIQMFGVRREQGRLGELATVGRALAQGERSSSPWRPGFAALLAELGMEQEAKRELEWVREEGFGELRSVLWLASLTYLADACAAVGDGVLAAMLYPELAPMSGACVVVGHGTACYGAADRYLGLLAATMGDHDRAIEHFERALIFNRRIGADTWVAHTLYACGRTLHERDRGDDRALADELLSEAATLAERIGMPVLLTRAQALGAHVKRPHTPTPMHMRDDTHTTVQTPALDDLSPRELAILRLVAAGRSNREIGEELFISGHTVANHVRSILRKTGAANRTEAAGYAYKHSLLDGADAR